MDNGLLDATLQQFSAQIQAAWGPQLLVFMVNILQAVTFLQFVVILAQTAMSRDFSHLFDDLAVGGIRVGIIWLIFTNSNLWGQAVIDTGKAIGQAIALGAPGTLTPSGVLNQGLTLAQIVWAAKGDGTWLHPVQDLEFFIAWIMIVLSWLVAALILFEVELEAAVLVYGGPILIAFSPFHWTGELIVHWAKGVFAIALKIAVILGLLAIGMGIAQIWAQQVANVSTAMTTNLWDLAEAIVMSLVFMYVLWKVPHMFTSLIGGSPAFQFGSAFAGALMGQAVSGGASLTGGAVSAAAQGVAAGVNSARSIGSTVDTWILAT